MNQHEPRPDADDILQVCRCGHIEDFHAKGNPALGEDRCCLALNCGCGAWERLRVSSVDSPKVHL